MIGIAWLVLSSIIAVAAMALSSVIVFASNSAEPSCLGKALLQLQTGPSELRIELTTGEATRARRRWLDEIISDPSANVETIAARESCSIRKVNMTISLAFLAPHLVKAAIEGRLPHGMGVVRLCDLPAEWSRQSQMLGLFPQ
jgi:hypothetical protein